MAVLYIGGGERAIHEERSSKRRVRRCRVRVKKNVRRVARGLAMV